MIHRSVYKSTNYYYLIGSNRIKIKKLDSFEDAFNIDVSCSVFNILFKEDKAFIINTQGKIICFDENNMIVSNFYKGNSKNEALYFTYLNSKLNSIIMLIQNVDKYITEVIKLNISTKEMSKFKLEDSIVSFFYYYDEDKIEALGYPCREKETPGIITFNLDENKFSSKKVDESLLFFEYVNNKYQQLILPITQVSDLNSTLFGNNAYLYDKEEDKVIDLSLYNINIGSILNFYDFKNYYYIVGFTGSVITDKNFNVLKIMKGFLTDCPSVFIDERYVIFQEGNNGFKRITIEEFFN